MNYVINRLREPTSALGLGFLLTLLGLPAQLIDATVQAVVAVLSVVAIALPERGKR